MTGSDLKKNPSTPNCGNTCPEKDWYVWYVDGFGVEEYDDLASEAIEAGERVSIISPPRPLDTGTEQPDKEDYE